jgi:hypothetical protein
MAYSWMKIYFEILDDPKMTTLPDFLYRRTIELFLLAGRNGDDGKLQPVSHMAWMLRVDEKRLADNLRSLEKIGVVAETEPGQWVVVNFAKRQAAEDSTERVRAFRERKKKEIVPETPMERDGNDNVTERYTDQNKKKILNTEREIDDPVAQKLDTCKFPLNPNAGVIIQGWKDDFPDDVIIRAIDWAKQHGARSLSYVDQVVLTWKIYGVPPTREEKAVTAARKPGAKMSMDDFNASLARAVENYQEV